MSHGFLLEKLPRPISDWQQFGFLPADQRKDLLNQWIQREHVDEHLTPLQENGTCQSHQVLSDPGTVLHAPLFKKEV